jgi:hypothetical protein
MNRALGGYASIPLFTMWLILPYLLRVSVDGLSNHSIIITSKGLLHGSLMILSGKSSAETSRCFAHVPLNVFQLSFFTILLLLSKSISGHLQLEQRSRPLYRDDRSRVHEEMPARPRSDRDNCGSGAPGDLSGIVQQVEKVGRDLLIA